MIKTQTLQKYNKIYCNWIIENFPENYQEGLYFEPFCGNANVLFSKEQSKTEVINDMDENLVQVYKALRDEPKEFIKRLNRCKYCEDTFSKALAKEVFDDYLDHAINECILIKMSRQGEKKVFSKKATQDFWKKTIKSLAGLTDRLHAVHIYSQNALNILPIFNTENALVYCDPPNLESSKLSKSVYTSEMETKEHIELARILHEFKGKVIITGQISPLYKRLYKDWNMSKKKILDQKAEVIWKNY